MSSAEIVLGNDPFGITASAYHSHGFGVLRCTTVGTTAAKMTKDGTAVVLPIAAPTLVTVGSTSTGGSLPNGTYYVTITWTNSYGETIASNEVSTVVSSGTATNRINITVPAFPAGITGANVYISDTSGTEHLAKSVTAAGVTTVLELSPNAPFAPAWNSTPNEICLGALSLFNALPGIFTSYIHGASDSDNGLFDALVG